MDSNKLKALQLSIVETFGVPILSGGWVNLPEVERKAFADAFLSFAGKDSAMSKLSTKFNRQVWDGHENGTIPDPAIDKIKGISGTRDKRDPNGDKPGRKAVVKTPEEILFGITADES